MTSQAHQQDWGVPGPIGHVLDQIEEGGLRPVDVVEHGDQRLAFGQGLQELADRPEHLVQGCR